MDNGRTVASADPSAVIWNAFAKSNLYYEVEFTKAYFLKFEVFCKNLREVAKKKYPLILSRQRKCTDTHKPVNQSNLLKVLTLTQ